MKQVRCAIYTRKSSDEGLEQSFNSLDAQREACSAYILSQASEGWVEVGERYDDGGLSGGTLQRPALQRLLADVAAGRIDIIVVYKVDRLTRSLLDFAKLVEALDKASTSFVSVTQAFNTTTSMGRLTLNMLLSFAQFEREVTAERIRDKIAASKAKGMWMGGIPPLGYAPDGRSLKIFEEHAKLIRGLFTGYLALGNVRLLQTELATKGITTPARTMRDGRAFGGVPFTRGQIYAILRNAIYVGEVRHREQVYPGLHPAIIDRKLWEEVQARLAEQRQGSRRGPRAELPSLLAGLVNDEAGEPLLAVHATKGKVRYRYYVSRGLQQATSSTGMRIPARELEAAVTERLASVLDDPLALIGTVWLDVPPAELPRLGEQAQQLAATVRSRSAEAVRKLIGAVVVDRSGIEITCNGEELASQLDVSRAPEAPLALKLRTDVRLTRTGRMMRLITPSGGVAPRQDASLVRLIVKAHRWWRMLRAEQIDVTRLAQRERVAPAYVTRVLRLAFLSPEATAAVLAGRQAASVTAATLTATDAVRPSWADQRSLLLTVG